MVAAKKRLALNNTRIFYSLTKKQKQQDKKTLCLFRKISYYYYLKQLELSTLVDYNNTFNNRNLKLINALDNNDQSQKKQRYLVRHNVKKPR